MSEWVSHPNWRSAAQVVVFGQKAAVVKLFRHFGVLLSTVKNLRPAWKGSNLDLQWEDDEDEDENEKNEVIGRSDEEKDKVQYGENKDYDLDHVCDDENDDGDCDDDDGGDDCDDDDDGDDGGDAEVPLDADLQSSTAKA